MSWIDWSTVSDSVLAEAEAERSRRYFAREKDQRRRRNAEIDRIAADPVLYAQHEAERLRRRKLEEYEFWLEHGNAP